MEGLEHTKRGEGVTGYEEAKETLTWTMTRL